MRYRPAVARPLQAVFPVDVAMRLMRTARKEGSMGPHDVISSGEVIAELVVIAIAFVAFTWMAYRNRHIKH